MTRSPEEELRLKKNREYMKEYYKRNRRKMIDNVMKSREKISELQKAEWNAKYWNRKVAELKALESNK